MAHYSVGRVGIGLVETGFFDEDGFNSVQVTKLKEDLLLAESKIADLQTELSMSNEHQLQLNTVLKQLQAQLDTELAQTKQYKAQIVSMELNISSFQARISELELQLLTQITKGCEALQSLETLLSEEPKPTQILETKSLEDLLISSATLGKVTEEEKELLIYFEQSSSDYDQREAKTIIKAKDSLLRLLPSLSSQDQQPFYGILSALITFLN